MCFFLALPSFCLLAFLVVFVELKIAKRTMHLFYTGQCITVQNTSPMVNFNLIPESSKFQLD